jgi:hypothetical protein
VNVFRLNLVFEKCRNPTEMLSGEQDFGPQYEEITGEWKKLLNVDLNNLSYQTFLRFVTVVWSRMMGLAGLVERMGEMRSA